MPSPTPPPRGRRRRRLLSAAECVDRAAAGGRAAAPAAAARSSADGAREHGGGPPRQGRVLFSRLTELGPSLAGRRRRLRRSLGRTAPSALPAICSACRPSRRPRRRRCSGIARLVESLLSLQPQVGSATARRLIIISGRQRRRQRRRPGLWRRRRRRLQLPPATRLDVAADGAAISEHLDAVAAQLSALWSAKMLPLLYTDALAVPLGTRPVDGALRALNADRCRASPRARARGSAARRAALKALPPSARARARAPRLLNAPRPRAVGAPSTARRAEGRPV